MNNSNLSKEKFSKMVDKTSPNSKIFSNCTRAFLVGGAICAFAQLLSSWYMYMGLDKESSGTLVSITLIFITALLTGIGVFDNIGKFSGAGSFVPITGFANAIAAPAIEYKKEGFIFGVGAKMFTIAGPVIVYGVSASIIVGLIYYIFK